MMDYEIFDNPKRYQEIEQKSEDIGFTMPSDRYVGTLLKTLVSSKPGGDFLELGTGTGLSLSWMVDGMDKDAKLVTVDNDPKLLEIAKHYFDQDRRVQMFCADGADWIREYDGEKFDLIFADAWPGKYSEIEKTLSLVKLGGFYVIDDMSMQENWPEGHQDKVTTLVAYLEGRDDFNLTKLDWSTGLIVAVRTKI